MLWLFCHSLELSKAWTKEVRRTWMAWNRPTKCSTLVTALRRILSWGQQWEYPGRGEWFQRKVLFQASPINPPHAWLQLRHSSHIVLPLLGKETGDNNNTNLSRLSVSQTLFSFWRFHGQIVAWRSGIRWLLFMITSKVILPLLGVLCLGVFYLSSEHRCNTSSSIRGSEEQSFGSASPISDGHQDRDRHHQHRATGLFVCLLFDS